MNKEFLSHQNVHTGSAAYQPSYHSLNSKGKGFPQQAEVT